MVDASQHMTSVDIQLPEQSLHIKGEIVTDEFFNFEGGSTIVLFDASINTVEVGELNCNPILSMEVIEACKYDMYNEAQNYSDLIEECKAFNNIMGLHLKEAYYLCLRYRGRK